MFSTVGEEIVPEKRKSDIFRFNGSEGADPFRIFSKSITGNVRHIDLTATAGQRLLFLLI